MHQKRRLFSSSLRGCLRHSLRRIFRELKMMYDVTSLRYSPDLIGVGFLNSTSGEEMGEEEVELARDGEVVTVIHMTTEDKGESLPGFVTRRGRVRRR